MIGSSFSTELKSAGLLGLPFSWSPDGEIFGRENLTEAQSDVLDAVIADHDPSSLPPIMVIHKAYINAALSQMDKLDAVNQAVATMPAWKQQLWEFPSNINIGDADVVAVCDALSIDRRKLFDLAETIRTSR